MRATPHTTVPHVRFRDGWERVSTVHESPGRAAFRMSRRVALAGAPTIHRGDAYALASSHRNCTSRVRASRREPYKPRKRVRNACADLRACASTFARPDEDLRITRIGGSVAGLAHAHPPRGEPPRIPDMSCGRYASTGTVCRHAASITTHSLVPRPSQLQRNRLPDRTVAVSPPTAVSVTGGYSSHQHPVRTVYGTV
jgi:hypothetical protein